MRKFLHDIGFSAPPPFYKDPLFSLALLGGGLFWLILPLVQPFKPLSPDQLFSSLYFIVVIQRPIFEEILFRGLLQGILGETAWGEKRVIAIRGTALSVANVVTSLLFALAHLFAHPPLWAASVFIPSLLFGFFRDRHKNLFPPIFLHIFYNGGYFFLTGLPG
ncbi:MAG: JDVT-CTERM system glutamic-type intramembrane protease [Candidatus Manganitrophaceae bacterium]